MENVFKKFFLRKRRGVSNIIGSLIVLALVASVGSVILFQGLNQINAFNYELSLHDREKINELREDVVFEHIRFDPSSNQLELFLANVGSVDTTIASVTIVKIDTQDLILRNQTVNQPILIESNEKIIQSPTLAGTTVWDDPAYNDSIYKITVGTSKGNYFSTVAEPFNS